MTLTRYEFLKKAAGSAAPFVRRQRKRWKVKIETERMNRFMDNIQHEAQKQR